MKRYIAAGVFAVALLAGYFMPERVSAQLPSVLFGTNNGVIQPIKATGNALWVTVTGGLVTVDNIEASDQNGISLSSYIPDVNGAAFTPALAGTGAGNVDNGVHSYKFTFTTVEGETAAGTATPTVTVVDKTADGKVTVKIPYTYNSAQIVAVKIYRTVAAGSVYKLVESIDPGDFAYTDNTADADLGATAPTVNTTLGVRYTQNGQTIYPAGNDDWNGINSYLFGNPSTNDIVNFFTNDAVTPTADGSAFNLVAGNSANGNGGVVSINAGSSSTGTGGSLELTSGGGAGGNGNIRASTDGQFRFTVDSVLRLIWTEVGNVLKSDYVFGWSSGAATDAADTGLARSAAGVVKVTNGSSGYGALDAGELRINGVSINSPGTWTSVAYNAGDYTAQVGTWTVAAGDVTTFKYVLVGKVMTISILLATTDFSDDSAFLSVLLPASKTAAATMETAMPFKNDANGTGLCLTVASDTRLYFQRVYDAGSNFIDTSQLALACTITFEVQ